MTIRFTCDKCGSVLKIKDELAGTDGKCPKCKTRFVVPQPAAEDHVENVVQAAAPEPPSAPAIASVALEPDQTPKAPSKPTAKEVAKPAPKGKPKPPVDEDFDPVSFLMEEPRKKPTLDADPEPTSPNRPSGGRPGRNGGGKGFSLDDTEDDAWEEPVDEKPVAPTRRWGAKPDSSAAAAADRSLGSTNAAKDLLARSMEESRLRAGEMPEAKPRFNFDFAGLFREIGVKTFGTTAVVIVAVVCVYWMMTSMVTPKVRLPPLGYVSGTLTIGGKPAAGVYVFFEPINHEIPGSRQNKERARESIGVTDALGHFDLFYTAEVKGAKVGPCKVWMESMDPSVVIPLDYGPNSKHKVDVTAGKNQPQMFEL